MRAWFRLYEFQINLDMSPTLNDNPHNTWFYLDLGEGENLNFHNVAERLKTILGENIWQKVKDLKVDTDGSIQHWPGETKLDMGFLLAMNATFTPIDTEHTDGR